MTDRPSARASRPMTAFLDPHPMDMRCARLPGPRSPSLTAGRSFFSSPVPLDKDEEALKHELVVQVLASLCQAGDALRPPAPLSTHSMALRSPSPSSPSSPEQASFSPPQLLFHQHTVRPSERSHSRHSRERSLSADEERREEEKRERRREKDRVRKRVQREKQRREKALQARSAQVNLEARSGNLLPPLHAAVALN